MQSILLKKKNYAEYSVHFTTRFRVFCRYTGAKRRVHVMVPSRGDAYILHYRPRFRCKYWES